MSETIRFTVGQSSAAEINRHLQQADMGFTPRLSSRVSIADYAQKLHDFALCFEAWQDNELIGLVAAYCNGPEGEAAFVSSVSVLPKFQGKGIAKRLMQHCIDHVRSQAFRIIALEVDSSTVAAINLYRNLGFLTRHVAGNTLTMEMPLKRRLI